MKLEFKILLLLKLPIDQNFESYMREITKEEEVGGRERGKKIRRKWKIIFKRSFFTDIPIIFHFLLNANAEKS